MISSGGRASRASISDTSTHVRPLVYRAVNITAVRFIASHGAQRSTGSIPRELGQLKDLEVLHLQVNHLSGQSRILGPTRSAPTRYGGNEDGTITETRV